MSATPQRARLLEMEMVAPPRKIVKAEPAPAASTAPAQSSGDVAKAIRDLAKQIAEAEPAAAPDITVEAPSVTVNPQVTLSRNETVEAEVTEWTQEGRIKKMRFKITG
jgi:cell division septum initiation protein DivIVA